MPEIDLSIIAITFYKLFTIFVGLAFAFMGYRLFQAGIFTESGELDATWSESRLIVKRAAPGTFFALFGMAVISLSVYQKLEINIIHHDDIGPHRIQLLGSEIPTEADSDGFSTSMEMARSYTVQPGDTLRTISNREGISLNALIAANPDLEPDRIQIGQELRIPDTWQPLSNRIASGNENSMDAIWELIGSELIQNIILLLTGIAVVAYTITTHRHNKTVEEQLATNQEELSELKSQTKILQDHLAQFRAQTAALTEQLNIQKVSLLPNITAEIDQFGHSGGITFKNTGATIYDVSLSLEFEGMTHVVPELQRDEWRNGTTIPVSLPGRLPNEKGGASLKFLIVTEAQIEWKYDFYYDRKGKKLEWKLRRGQTWCRAERSLPL